jgi:tetratricopeptide (TPR) repeat protein
MKNSNSRRRFLLQSSAGSAILLWFSQIHKGSKAEAVIPSFVDSQDASAVERVWYSDTGSRLQGTFVEFKPTPYDLGSNRSLGKVSLLRSTDKKVFDVPFEKLSEFDHIYVASREFAAADLEQFEKLLPQLNTIKSNPASSAAPLKELERRYATAPYASLCSAVALAVGSNQIDEAIKANERALKRCQTQRSMDPTRHGLTLASIWNNQGVLHIKKKQFELSVADFERAMNLAGEFLPALTHNVSSMKELVASGALFKGQPGPAKKLEKLTEDLASSGSKSTLPKGWYFSTAFDLPKSIVNELNVLESRTIHPTFELVSFCNGVVIAPGIVVTTRQSIIPYDRPVELITVGRPQSKQSNIGASWTHVIVDEAIVIGTQPNEKIHFSTMPKQNAGATFPYSPGNSNQFQQTSFHLVDPSDSSSTEGQLAVLAVKNLNVPPAPISNNAPSVDQKILMLGYGRSYNSLKNGHLQIKGTVSKPQDNGTFLIKEFNNQPINGFAVIDSSYHVTGLHGDSRAVATLEPSKEGVAYSTEVLSRLLQRTTPNSTLPTQRVHDKDKAKKLAEDANVPIFGWARRDDIQKKPALQTSLLDFTKKLNSIDELVVRDVWCVRCNGNGITKCFDCNGTGEVVEGNKIVTVGINPSTGQPITQVVPNRITCRKCNGVAKVRCDQCKNGKI